MQAFAMNFVCHKIAPIVMDQKQEPLKQITRPPAGWRPNESLVQCVLLQGHKVLPHGEGDPVDENDPETFSGPSLIRGLVEGGNDVVVKPPHGSGGRIDNEQPNEPPKGDVAKIPTVD